MKILVVDDDLYITDLLPIILENEGFRDVECCSSSRDAYAMLKKPCLAFDCLMLDIDMPGMNGIELCMRVRKLSKYENVPILMLTALRDVETVREALAAGATDYITKPFDVLQIGVRVRMSAHLVHAHRALNNFRCSQDEERYPTIARGPNVTRKEMINIFAEDLYKSTKG